MDRKQTTTVSYLTRALSYSGPPEIQTRVRKHAARAIGKMGERASEAVCALKATLLTDKDRAVIAEAAMALGKMGANAQAILEEACRNEDVWTAICAIAGLGHLPSDLMHLFESVLENGEARLCHKAIDVLGTLRSHANDVKPLLKKAIRHRIPSVRGFAVEALGNHGPIETGVLEEILQDRDQFVRYQFVKTLTMKQMVVESEQTIDFLREAVLHDTEFQIRWFAVSALAIQGPTAIPTLELALENENSGITRQVIEKLAQFGVEAMESLDRALRRGNYPLIPVRALEMMGPAAVPVLERSLESDNPSVCIFAAGALIRLTQSVAAFAALKEKLASSDVSTRRKIAAQLENAGPEAISILKELVRDQTRDIRRTAAETLGTIGPEAISTLEPALHDKDVLVRYYAAKGLRRIGPEALPVLSRAITDANPDIRCTALLGLFGETVDTNMWPLLVEASCDDNPDVRARAAALLGNAGTRALHTLSDLMLDVDNTVRSRVANGFARIGYEAVPFLEKMLCDPCAEVRQAAAEGLSRMGIDSLPVLEQILLDRTSCARAEAATAMRELGILAVPALEEALKQLNGNLRDGTDRHVASTIVPVLGMIARTYLGND